MTRLVWDNDSSPKYRTGVSQGVFYGEDGVGFAWSGLISVTDRPQANEPTAVYNSLGQKYDLFGNVSEMKHGLTCYTYPEEMDEFLGMEYLDDFGFKAYERPPKKFHMAYRTELGNGLYEIHVLLNQIATFGDTARQTVAASPSLTTITMNLEGSLDSRFKSSHIVLDSRLPITRSAERLLFGDQYTDANIDSFLTAEPVWETIATNYAPTIEPDYDNYVWLGGKNLVSEFRWYANGVEYKSSYINADNDSAYSLGRIYTNEVLEEGDLLTIQVKGVLPEGREQFRLFNPSSSTGLVDLIPGPNGIATATFNHKVDPTGATFYLLNSGLNITNATENPGITHVEWVKIERGEIASPWIPAPEDGNQNPRPTNRNPSNYKPGVKYGPVWSTNSSILFYDELTKGLGIYSTRLRGVLGDTPVRMTTLVHEEIANSSVNAYADVTLHAQLEGDLKFGFGRFRTGESNPLSSLVPNQRGTHHTSVSVEHLNIGESGWGDIIIYHGGAVESGTITYNNLMVAHSSYTGEFFDANTKPKARGTRYQRIVTDYGDYTEFQQLRLRTTSKVILSDVTYYDYWLEAADSMLLLQNETFTFNGPQAIIDGDTFTIDDSILGFEEG